MNRKFISGFLSISILFSISNFSSLGLDNDKNNIVSETVNTPNETRIDSFLKGSDSILRISGKDRVDTSVLLSRFENTSSKTVIIADGRNYPDALSASNLTEGQYPILLINNSLTENITNEITRLKAEKVIVLGGENSISSRIENELSSISGVKQVIRINGSDRYSTSAKAFLLKNRSSVILASGENYPDALSSSSLVGEYGIVLTRKNNIPSSVGSLIGNLHTQDAIAIGGNNSISSELLKNLRSRYGISSINRITGVNRYETSVNVAKRLNSNVAIIASGESFPDALAASTLSQKLKAPVLLINKNSINRYVENYVSSNQIKKAIILGGTSTISSTSENRLNDIINNRNTAVSPQNSDADKNINSDKADTSSDSQQVPENLFKPVPINESVKKRIWNKSYKPNPNIKLEDLCYIPVAYNNFKNQTEYGEIIVNKKVGAEVGNIFREIYNAKIKIEKIKLIDEYNADDVKSMEANNSSAFNYRVIKGSNRLSKHALGLAIDINPLYNPHVVRGVANPKAGQKYAIRTRSNPYMIFKNDKLYNIFKKYGWHWGGEWKYPDYQHFEK